MSGAQILLVAAVVLIPLAIAVAVTLWTLEPAARRAERAKRSRKRAQPMQDVHQGEPYAPVEHRVPAGSAEGDVRTNDSP